MRYLNYTLEFAIWYSTSSSICLSGYSDADFAGCRTDRKSASGTCHFLGTSLIAWSSRKQSSVAQWTVESEYVAAANCCSQILWLISTLKDYGLTFEKVSLFCDNTTAINIAKNPVQSILIFAFTFWGIMLRRVMLNWRFWIQSCNLLIFSLNH